jgi:hypothetical protein
MNDGIKPGARVRVEIPRSSPCPLHCLDSVPVLEAVGCQVELAPDELRHCESDDGTLPTRPR